MNKYIKGSVGSLLLLLSFASCSEQAMMMQEGEGVLRIGANLKDQIETGAFADLQTLADSAEISIYNQEGLVRFYKGLSNIPQTISLKSDTYTAAIEAGDSVPASFEYVYYKGSSNFDIEKGKLADVELKATMVNSVVQVNIEPLEDVFTDYTLKLYVGTDSVTYTIDNLDQKSYFMLPDDQTPISWIFEGTQLSGDNYVQEGSIEDPQEAYLYEMDFKFDETTIVTGATFFDVSVNAEEYVLDHNIVISLRPQISGVGYDLNSKLFLELNTSTPLVYQVVSFTPLTSLEIVSSSLSTYGAASDTLNLITQEAQAAELGITYVLDQLTSPGEYHYSVSFSGALMAQLTAKDVFHTFILSAKDSKLKERSETLNIITSSALFMAMPVDPMTVWATQAQLKGKMLEQNGMEYSFRYAKAGTELWDSIAAEEQGAYFTAQLTDLEPGTTYIYQAFSGPMMSNAVETFTTESATQLPNSSFEYWTSGSPMLIFDQSVGQSMFWDSGNHGSATMNKNVTLYDESIYHSGKRSAKLVSQFVGIFGIGKFAAGNLFAGQYLATEGTSGVISFGRPFTDRPKRVRAYYKYVNGEVNYTDNATLMAKGVPDTMTVYVALGDWTPEKYNEHTAPVLIKNNPSELQLFDVNSPNIIAYGKMERGTATTGDGMHELVFDLDYRTLDRKPTHIVVVASASKYGDYYAGSTSSVLWLDDFELVYE